MGPRARSAPTSLLLLLAGCAGPSTLPRAVEVEEGRRVRVALTDASGRTLAMQNLSSGSRTEVYSDRGAAAQPKVIRDADLQTLLDALAERGMFENASPAAAPGARSTIVVETPDRSWIWSRPAVDPSKSPDEQPLVGRYDEARAYVLFIYNSEMSFHAGSVESFSPETRKKIDEARGGTFDAKKRDGK
jgi:hypothetical protein